MTAYEYRVCYQQDGAHPPRVWASHLDHDDAHLWASECRAEGVWGAVWIERKIVTPEPEWEKVDG